MRKNPLNKGIIMENAAGIGTVTSEMVEARARELAAINGHPSKPSEADYQQAKRELSGEEESDPQEENVEMHPPPRDLSLKRNFQLAGRRNIERIWKAPVSL